MAVPCNHISQSKLLGEEVDPMDSAIIVAVVSGVCTLLGSGLGVLAANKLVTFRLERLEKKQDIHNGVIERVYKIEGQMTEMQHDIKDLKSYHRPT